MDKDRLNLDNNQYRYFTKNNKVFVQDQELSSQVCLNLGLIDLDNFRSQLITLAKLRKDFKIVGEQEARIILAERLKSKTEKKLNELLFNQNKFIRDLASKEIKRRKGIDSQQS